MKANCHMSCMDTAHRISYGTMHNILHEELGLVKKLVRWVSKLLNEDRSKSEICMDFVAVQTKQHLKRWIKNGLSGPVKAKVHVSRIKHMVPMFFDRMASVH
jgi:hypothetical protein